ncbi:MAG: hypothetical protein DRI24_24070 [Deltaproteobacteria bacterium]|nr:MAG: hypothetical protein DRI24_24070 [Deltaproteobacteria bacterium]
MREPQGRVRANHVRVHEKNESFELLVGSLGIDVGGEAEGLTNGLVVEDAPIHIGENVPVLPF